MCLVCVFLCASVCVCVCNVPAAALRSIGSEVSIMKRTGATIRNRVVELYHAALQREREQKREGERKRKREENRKERGGRESNSKRPGTYVLVCYECMHLRLPLSLPSSPPCNRRVPTAARHACMNVRYASHSSRQCNYAYKQTCIDLSCI